MTSRALRWAVVALLLGLGVGLARTTALTIRDVRWTREADAAPLDWLPGSKQVRALDAHLRLLDAPIPDGSRVRFSPAPGLDRGQAGIVLLWAQHLRPQYDWLLAEEWPPPIACRYWLTFGTHLEQAGWQPVVEKADGGLYEPVP